MNSNNNENGEIQNKKFINNSLDNQQIGGNVFSNVYSNNVNTNNNQQFIDTNNTNFTSSIDSRDNKFINNNFSNQQTSGDVFLNGDLNNNYQDINDVNTINTGNNNQSVENNIFVNNSLNNINENVNNQQMNYGINNMNLDITNDNDFSKNDINSGTNNMYRNNNGNSSDSKNSSLKEKVANNKKFILIGVIIFLLIVGGFKIFNVIGISHKNNTGSTEYNNSDVDLNCVYNYSDDKKDVTIYSDFLFNYKSKGDVSYNYMLKIYNKKINVYSDGVTDDIYNNFVEENFSNFCGGFTGISCSDSHLDLGITDWGWDTIVDRLDNKIIVSYTNIYGIGQTAKNKDMEEIKKAYIEDEFKCK